MEGEGETPVKRPNDTAFRQQKLKAWQPILTPNWVIGTFFFVGLIFIPIGVILKTASDNVVEYSIQYDGYGALTSANTTTAKGLSVKNNGESPLGCTLLNETQGDSFNVNRSGCLLRFTLDRDMKGPIYVYYQLDNFYQNHRRYVASRSDEQLRGEKVVKPSECEPLIMATKTFKYDSIDKIPTKTNPSDFTLVPCGLIANSMFNDIFWVNSITHNSKTYYQTDKYNNVEVVNVMNQTGIAWESDINDKFINIAAKHRQIGEMYLWENPKYRFIVPKNNTQSRVLNVTAWTANTTNVGVGVKNEHFIVWMRTAGLPHFRKLYGKINMDLKAGTELEFLVSSNFVVNTFEGKKSLVISTTSSFGGRNPFLGIAYIVNGVICLVLSILFVVKHKLSPRKLGDTRYLVWKTNQ